MRVMIDISEGDTCEECPYYRSENTDFFFWDCTKLNGKDIATEQQMLHYETTWADYLKSSKTLFPLPRPTVENPLLVPKWCPFRKEIK
jgi:hypothetical protein